MFKITSTVSATSVVFDLLIYLKQEASLKKAVSVCVEMHIFQ